MNGRLKTLERDKRALAREGIRTVTHARTDAVAARRAAVLLQSSGFVRSLDVTVAAIIEYVRNTPTRKGW
jgi:hypothetical protein